MKDKKLAVIGSGIAGLAYAYKCKQLGYEVSLFERDKNLRRGGLGFILLDNGIEAAEYLGIKNDIVKKAHPLKYCRIFDEKGINLTTQPLHNAYGMTRKNFIGALLNKVPEEWITYNKKFDHFEYNTDGSAKEVVFEDGSRFDADYFLGCDGVNSPIRRNLFPATSLTTVNVQEVVSMIKNQLLVSKLKGQFLKFRRTGGGLALGLLPADHESIIWYFQYDATRYNFSDLDSYGRRQLMEKLTKNWPDPIQQLIESTDFESSHIWKARYLKPLPSYYKKNVALLGDAAHALLSFTSQGVNSAMEDAICLAEAFAQNSATAFDIYSTDRRNSMLKYVDQGLKLKDDFLRPSSGLSKVPLAFASN